jgi:hypothetical protein
MMILIWGTKLQLTEMKIELKVLDVQDNVVWSKDYDHNNEHQVKRNVGVVISILHTIQYSGSHQNNFGIENAGENKLLIELRK